MGRPQATQGTAKAKAVNTELQAWAVESYHTPKARVKCLC